MPSNDGTFSLSLVLAVKQLLDSAAHLFLCRWLHWPVERFSSSKNPGNAKCLVLTRRSGGLPSKPAGSSASSPTAASPEPGSDYYRLTCDSLRQLGFDTKEEALAAAESQPETWTIHSVDDSKEASDVQTEDSGSTVIQARC